MLTDLNQIRAWTADTYLEAEQSRLARAAREPEPDHHARSLYDRTDRGRAPSGVVRSISQTATT